MTPVRALLARLPRPWSRAGRIAAAGALAVVAAWVAVDRLGHWRAARAAFPVTRGNLRVEGLRAPLEVLRDRRGVPHVEAESETDALFALGFVHAQDRLGQMLWLRRSARGTTAEVAGPAGLASDRIARLLGIGRLADGEAAALSAEAGSALEAYARGVNARLARIERGEVAPPLAARGSALPIEPWSPADSIAVLKLYAWGLSGTLDASLVLADLIERLGGFESRTFFPRSGGGDVPPTAALPVSPQGHGFSPLVPDPLRRSGGWLGRSVGSSSWVVSGSASASGAPLLAADAHLPPTVPAQFYEAHLRGGSFDAAGATLPGVPAIWMGHNRRVAWAATHAGAVTLDLYVETLSPTESGRYHDGNDWRDLAERVESIRVREAGTERLRIRSTHHGPLLDDLGGVDRGPLALAWAGARARGAESIAALLAVARARDAAALRAALARHEEPVLTFAFVDGAGAAGLQVAGWIPRRSLPTGMVPVPGGAGWYDWRGRVAFEDLPRVDLDGGARWAIASDNAIAPAAPGVHIDWTWRSAVKARRIEQLLREADARRELDLRALTAMQGDTQADSALELVQDALAVGGGDEALGAEAREVARLLADWDGREAAGSAGAAAHHVFIGHLTRELFAERLGPELLRRFLALTQADPAAVVARVVREARDGGDSGGWADRATVQRAVQRSLRESWKQLSFELGASRRRWQWGRLHTLRFHPLRSMGEGDRAVDGIGPFEYGGSGVTVNAAEYDRLAPFGVRVASTYRFAVDAAALGRALSALAPGQSEHPGHAHFADGVEPWLEGRATLLSSDRLHIEEASRERLVLDPAR